MRTLLRTLAVALITVLTAAGLTMPAHAAPPLKTGTKISFTDSRGVKSWYHLYADGIDWSKPVGALYYLDGDYFSESPKYSQVMQPKGSMLKSVAKNANSKNLILVAPKTPSAKTKANGWTWWEQGNRNARWFHDLATSLQKKGKLDKKHTWLAGYSGGAELISFNLMTQNRTKWMTGGGAIMIAGGGSGSKTKPHSANKNIPMTWYVGSKDTSGQTNPPTWSALNAAKKGQKTYKNAGYKGAKINIINGVGHKGYNLASLINKTTKSAKGSSSSAPKKSTTTTQKINKQYQTTRANVQLKNTRNSKAKALVTVKAKGTKVTMVERSGSWAKVKYKSKTYWSPWAHYTPAKASSSKTSTTKTQKINKQYQTTTSNVKIMNGRGTKAKRLATASKKGTKVTMVERYGSWAKVKYGKTTGWSAWKNFTPAKAASATKTQKINKTYQTNRASVRIMDGRGTKAKRLATVSKKGTKVTMIERYGSWAKVKHGKTTGWSPWAHYKR